jgi:O-antigen ligase
MTNNQKFLLLLSTWILIIFSLGAKPSILDFEKKNFFNLLESFRINFAVIISFILFFFLYDVKKFIKIKIFFFFILYYIFQIIGLYQNNEINFNLDNLYLVILSLGSIGIIYLALLIPKKEILEVFLYILIAIIFTISIILLGKALLDDEFTSIYWYNAISPGKIIFENTDLSYPRITGIARSLAVANILIVIFFLKEKNFERRIALAALSTIIGIIIWSAQSRGAILCYFSVLFIIIFLYKEKKILNKIFLFLFLFILPIATLSISNIFYKNKILANVKYDSNGEKVSPINQSRFTQLKLNSSGRIDLWSNSLTLYNKNKIFGYGPQADRFLLPLSGPEGFGNNVSNGYIYSFLSGGYPGVIIFLAISINIFLVIYKNLFIKKIFNNNNKISIKIATMILVFFLIRSFFENSYALFSIDFLLILVSLFIAKKKN